MLPDGAELAVPARPRVEPRPPPLGSLSVPVHEPAPVLWCVPVPVPVSVLSVSVPLPAIISFARLEVKKKVSISRYSPTQKQLLVVHRRIDKRHSPVGGLRPFGRRWRARRTHRHSSPVHEPGAAPP